MRPLEVTLMIVGIVLIAIGLISLAIGLVAFFRSQQPEGNTTFSGFNVTIKAPMPIAVAIVLVFIGAILLGFPLYLSERNGVGERNVASPPEETLTEAISTTITTATTVVATTVSTEPLPNIFPRVGDGKAFDFQNKGTVQKTYVDDANCHRADRPLGLRLTWNMTGGGSRYGGWGVQWEHPSVGFDASSFTSLLISVKGTKGGERFQVGLKDLNGTEVKIESEEKVAISDADWKQLKIDLSEFTDVDTARVANINIGFNENHGSGKICIDEIAFE